jgi:hypothetical protein
MPKRPLFLLNSQLQRPLQQTKLNGTALGASAKPMEKNVLAPGVMLVAAVAPSTAHTAAPWKGNSFKSTIAIRALNTSISCRMVGWVNDQSSFQHGGVIIAEQMFSQFRDAFGNLYILQAIGGKRGIHTSPLRQSQWIHLISLATVMRSFSK